MVAAAEQNSSGGWETGTAAAERCAAVKGEQLGAAQLGNAVRSSDADGSDAVVKRHELRFHRWVRLIWV